MKFDDIVHWVEVVLRSLRSPNPYEVDREGNLAQCLEQIDADVRDCRRALHKKGESELEERVAASVATMTAPVRDHLERLAAGAHLPAGRNAIMNLLPQEYVIRCACCRNTAERLRVLSDSVSFTGIYPTLQRVSLPLERAQALLATLERDGAGALCDQFERESSGHVISCVLGYCPECHALYCHDHYVTHTTWSGTWPDTIYGTCPEGHRRDVL